MTIDQSGANGRPTSILQSVQVLRGLAALMVVVTHVFSNLSKAGDVGEVGSILNFGVDVFFVISGFIMVQSTQGKPADMGGFILARIIRIVPLYWLALLAMFAVLVLTGGRVPAMSEVAQAALFIPYLDPGSGEFMPFLKVGWTLNYEMLFYIAFAATLLIGGRRQVLMITFMFALLVAGRLVLNPESAIGFRVTSPLLFEFSMGMFVGLIWRRLRDFPWQVGLALVVASVAGIVVLHPLHMEFGLARAIAHGVPAMMLVAGAIVVEPMFRQRLFVPLLALGNASYSLYLVHAIVLITLVGIMPETVPYWLRALVLTVICLTAGELCYRLVERPMTHMLRQWSGARPRAVAVT